MKRGVEATDGELRDIVRMTRRVEQLLEPTLQPSLLSGSLAVVLFFFSRGCLQWLALLKLHLLAFSGDTQTHVLVHTVK